MFEAKEPFVDELKNSVLKYAIVMRLNNFFFEMRFFLNMAEKGTLYLFGNGEYQLNPIRDKDLTNVCWYYNASQKELVVGCPAMVPQNEVAALEKYPPRIIYIQQWIWRFIICALQTFTLFRSSFIFLLFPSLCRNIDLFLNHIQN